MKQLNEVTFKSSSRLWFEILISQALECVKKHWTTKSESILFLWVPAHSCCCELLTYYIFLSSSSKESEEGCKHQAGNLPIRQHLKYKIIWGPSTYSGCFFFRNDVFIVIFTTEAVGSHYSTLEEYVLQNYRNFLEVSPEEEAFDNILYTVPDSTL